MPSTDELDGPHLFTRINGRRLATPLFAVLLLVELTDVIFAVDSVPAVLAVSHEQFIVFSSNAFAILGLRALYFLLADLHARFTYLQHGLAIILGFVGVKMIIHDWYHIPTGVSLLVIGLILAASIGFSLKSTSQFDEINIHLDDDRGPQDDSTPLRPAARRTFRTHRPGPHRVAAGRPLIADGDRGRRHRAHPRDGVDRRRRPAARRPAQVRSQLGGPVPVPRREDALVQRPRGDGPLQVLRL